MSNSVTLCVYNNYGLLYGIFLMSYIEKDFIPKSEYEYYRSGRLSEHELAVQGIGLYTAMVVLSENESNREAAKIPVRLSNITLESAGLYVASLALLDSDLQIVKHLPAQFQNGYWTNVSEQVKIQGYEEHDSKYGYKALQSYLKSYEGPLDYELIAISSSLSIPVSAT